MTKKMNERNNGACRLCLVEIYQKCDIISNTEKDMVQIILPDVNLEISENIVLCKTCSNLVEEAFIFKSTCLEIEDNIYNYASDEVQADLEKLIGLKDIDGGQRQKICRTCLDVIDNELVHELGCEKDNLLVNMLQKCLPEIDLHLTKQPVLCENCKSLLKKSYNFVCQCMENEQKISEYQRNNQGKTLDLIEAVQVITSKNEYKIPEINISNVLTSPNNSTKMGTSEQEKTERVVESVENENAIILSLVSIPHNQPKVDDIPGINIPNVLESPRDILKNESIEQEVTEKVVSSVQIVNANISPLMSPPQSQPDNEISQEDIIDCSQTIDLSELELASSVHAQSENDASKINNMDCHQKNDLIGIELPLYLPAEIYVSEAVNMDVDQQNESGELQLVSSKGNGEEIFVISDDDDVSDNSANENRQLMYNIRKRTKKKVSDEYAFREDLDDPAEDPDFNPEVDYSSDDISDVEKQKIEHKNKKRTPKPNKNIAYLYCKFCQFRHVDEVCLDEHIAICEAAENYRGTRHSELRQSESLSRRKEYVKNSRSKPKLNEAALWKRLEMIQQTLRNLEELKNMEKHKKEKRKKKKKAKRDFKKSEETDVSMQVQFTIKNAPIASHQTIQVAVDNNVRPQETENNTLVTENSIVTQKSSISSHSDALIILPETGLENSRKVLPLPEANRSENSSKDQNQNNIDSDDLCIIEDAISSTKSSEAEKVPINNRTSMLSHKELNVLKCEWCEFNTRFYDKMDQHVSSHFYRSATKCYSCIKTCKLNFRIAGDLINHLKNQHHRVNYKIYYWCVNCSSVFLAYSLLREHLHECPQKNKVMVKLFRSNTMIFCMVCDFETMHLDQAKLHRKTCHFKELTVVGDTIEID